MAVLMIGATEREKIAKIVERAKRRPVLLEQVRQGIADDTSVLHLKDRKPGFVRPPSDHVSFPGGYRAAYSVEEQPPGLCSHLSISVEGRSKKGMMPSPEAAAAIAQEFGVPFPPDKSWIEEFEPGEYAINLVSLITPREEGHA
jgi:hypothetical protein